MTRVWHLLIFCLVLAWAFDAGAYETQTHAAVLSRQAVNRSVLQTDPHVLQDLGIDPTETFSDSSGGKRTVQGLIEFGAVSEDGAISILQRNFRFTRHFYNPLTGNGMDEGNFRNQVTSPDWALAPRGSNADQLFSYRDARQYFFDALTTSSKSARETAFGLTFRTLGHVIHHLQDMAQPQHVRNDVHCSAVLLLCQVFGGVPRSPSFFETWTDLNDIRASISQRYTDPASVGYDIRGAAFTSVFNSPRRFWHTEPFGPNSPASGKGIAEFTNRNFVSAGTNFDKPQQPSPPFFTLPPLDPTKKSEPTVAELCSNPNLSPPCPSSMTALPQARLTFYETSGHDNFLDAPFTNPRASTESIFDEQLRVQGEQPVFALNRFNFDEAYKHLIPRAVAFSAGMINYFFRGKIDIVPDPDNVGAHLIKNLGPEAVSGKFELYYDSTDGTRKPVLDQDNRPLIWDSKVILASSGGQVAPNGGAMAVTGFREPADLKRPGGYMLVFVGDMGEEKAAEPGVIGAVAGKFIPTVASSEALYLAGLDASGNYIGVRVDKNGTKVVAGEFDPLRQFVERSQNPPFYVTRAHHDLIKAKQASITQSISGPAYQTLAVTTRNTFVLPAVDSSYFCCGAGEELLSATGRVWFAQSRDPAIGKFRFSVFRNPFSGVHMLTYSRQFVDAAGVARTAGGEVPFPALGGVSGSAHVGLSMFDDVLPVSADGLHVGHFLKVVSSSGSTQGFTTVTAQAKEIYELEIGLSAVPTLELKLLDSWQDTTSQTVVRSPSFSLLSVDGTLHSEQRFFIGYFNDARAMLRLTTDKVWSGSGQHNSTGGGFCLGSWPFLNYQELTTSQDIYPVGSLGRTIRCTASEGFTRVGQATVQPISHRAGDAIYREPPITGSCYAGDGTLLYNGCSAAILGLSTDYVYDASPLGEIFLAKPDLSVVIHKPRAGGIRQIEIPPNLVQLLAVLWL